MNKKILLCVLFALIIVGSILTTMTITGKATSQETIKIGATLPLTGSLSIYGESYSNGLMLAQEELKESNIELFIQDNEGNPTKAATDVTYLVNVENTPVIYNAMEFLTLASKDISEQSENIMISFTTYRVSEQDNSDYLFRDYWDMGNVGISFGKAADQINAEKVGIIGQQDSSFAYFKQGFEDNFDGEVVTEQIFQYGQTDFKTELLKLKAEDIDTIVVYAFPVEANQILKQMFELEMDSYNLISTEATESFVTALNSELLQDTNAISYMGAELTEDQAFINKYQAKFGTVPRPDALYAYESLKMIDEAVTACGSTDVDCIKVQIETDFDDYHNKFRDLPLVQYDNGWNNFNLN